MWLIMPKSKTGSAGGSMAAMLSLAAMLPTAAAAMLPTEAASTGFSVGLDAEVTPAGLSVWFELAAVPTEVTLGFGRTAAAAAITLAMPSAATILSSAAGSIMLVMMFETIILRIIMIWR